MKQRFLAGAAATLAVPAVALFAAGPALAAGSGSVQVSNTETVQAYLDPTGKLDVARVYEQVAMQGKGRVELRNPVEARGLRNLDGFGGFEVQQGQMVGSYDVDGERRVRTVSDYTKKLPLEVTVTYLLDGKPVTPGDVVGKSGRLEVRYKVRNVTGTPAEVSFDDGTGATSTATEDVVIPMVGSLSTTLPATFTDVASGEANIAGDGRGGTKLTFTMTLFGPIGAPEASFGYSAMITDGVVPKASVSALPVSPLDSASFKGGAESYKGGADTGVTLTAGATEIDANLLKLRDGAATLLGGLIQLRDGAKKLDAGLGAQILPGSRQLADGADELKGGTSQLRAGAADAKNGAARLDAGAGQLAAGTTELDAGAGKLKDGASQVDAGAGKLADGLRSAGEQAPQLLDGLAQVADGLDQVEGGLAEMSATVGGPDVKKLRAGLDAMSAGLGSTNDPNSLIGGIDMLRQQLAAAGPGIDKMEAGVFGKKGQSAYEQLGCAIKVINDLSTGAAAGEDPCYAATGGIRPLLLPTADPLHEAVLDGLAKQLAAGRARLADPANTEPNIDAPLSDNATLQQGLAYLRGRLLDRAVPGLVKIECGLSAAALDVCDRTKPGLKEALKGVGGEPGIIDGFDRLTNGVIAGIGGSKDTADDKTLRGGVNDLQDGIDQLGFGGLLLLDGLWQLSDGADALKGGTGQLAAGTKDLKTGSSQLRAGANELKEGTGQLSSGLGTLAAGTGKLDAGAGQLRDGASQLASGLGEAAGGASQLANGLAEAADGAPALRDGAQQLSDEGTSKLVEAGKGTAADYGQKYALITAGAERAKSEGMAYGAPEGAEGFTAYSLEIAGVDGEGSRNTGRALGALAIFGLAGGLLFWRRSLG